jgi:hypothetical protein
MLHIKNKIGDSVNKEYRMNFDGQPLVCKEFFELKYIHKKQKQTNKYDEFRRFAYFCSIYKKPEDSTLTLILNTVNGEMIFFVNSKPMEYISYVSISDFLCKFFICIE